MHKVMKYKTQLNLLLYKKNNFLNLIKNNFKILIISIKYIFLKYM